MNSKHSAKIIVVLAVLLFSLLYTLPSTTWWNNMFGALTPEEQSAIPIVSFEYLENAEAAGSTNLKIHANISADIFNKTKNPAKVEDVLNKVTDEIRVALVESGLVARVINTDYSSYSMTINVADIGPMQLKEQMAKSKLYAKMPLGITAFFPDKKITLGLDLKGGIDLVYQVDLQSLQSTDNIADAVQRSVEIIRNRIDMYGISEPSIKAQDKNRIRIQLPGIKDTERVKQLIQDTAMLQFHIVNYQATTADALGSIDSQNEIVLMQPGNAKQMPMWYRLNKKPDVTGADLKYAKVSFDELGRPIVNLEFNADGAAKFARVTGSNINKQLAIVLDNKVHSAPVIQSRITGGMAQITGNFTYDEAQNLSIVLRAGALPASLIALESRVVGPTLGQKSIDAGMVAGILGFILVLAYMVFVYGLMGVFADIAVVFNTLIVFSVLVFFGGTMTMPGIAGLILSVGMAVDANVIIFERIKEEYRSGKTVRASIASGFDRALACVIDSNITTLLVVAILYAFTSGPIRGFATTLGIGLIANVYTAIVFTKLLLDIRYGTGKIKTLNI
jgi:protein-export membrane protein SecD